MKRYSDRLFISFSGGETSAFMSWWLKGCWQELGYKEMKILFANTGQENEETLLFVDRFSKHHDLPVIWIESDLNSSEKFRVVDFESASRDGRPFRQIIEKYGIPNSKRAHCTRELKLYPMQRYMRTVGWKANTYDVAVGIRADEMDRLSATAEARKIIYPLISAQPMTKPKINSWFATQPFRLELKGYEGNCKWCWKKSKRKHMTLIKEHRDWYDFPAEMEKNFAFTGPEFRRGTVAPDYKRVFFRGSQSTADLLSEYAALKSDFQWADDDAIIFDSNLDVGGGCGDSESCEIYTDDEDSDVELDPLCTWLTAA